MNGNKLVIGLTGGIGSGKTLVSDHFASLGIDIVDADVIAREVVAPGSDALKEIASHFGDNFILENGELNRSALRNRVFSNPRDKQWLDNCLHPKIRAQMLAGIAACRSHYCVLAVPLLIENGLDSLVDRIAVVDCPVETQVARAMSRDGSDETVIRNIISAQCSRQQRLDKADDIIDNTGNKADTIKLVEKLHSFYLNIVPNMN